MSGLRRYRKKVAGSISKPTTGQVTFKSCKKFGWLDLIMLSHITCNSSSFFICLTKECAKQIGNIRSYFKARSFCVSFPKSVWTSCILRLQFNICSCCNSLFADLFIESDFLFIPCFNFISNPFSFC